MDNRRVFDWVVGGFNTLLWGIGVLLSLVQILTGKGSNVSAVAALLQSLLLMAGSIGICLGIRRGFLFHAAISFAVGFLVIGAVFTTPAPLPLSGIACFLIAGGVYSAARARESRKSAVPEPSATKLWAGTVILLYAATGCLLVTSLVVALLPANRTSGMKIEGKYQSVKDVDEGLREMGEMAKGAKAGEPSSFNASFQPKTALGRRFKSFLAEAGEVKRKYDADTANNHLETILTAPRLISAQERAKSLKDLDESQRIEIAFYDKNMELAKEFSEIMASVSPEASADKLKLLGEETERLKTASIAMLDSYRAIIRHVGASKIQPGGDQILFESDSELKKFKDLCAEGDKAEQNLAAISDAVMKRRTDAMAHGMEVLSRG